MSHGWVMPLLGALAAAVLFLVVPRRRAAAMSERSMPDEPSAVSLVGGGTWFTMWWPLGATWPFVRLEQFSWGVRIGPNLRWTGWLFPTTDLPWSEILLARTTSTTIRFTTRSAPHRWVSFGPNSDPRLIDALRQNGVDCRE